jgi:hypothetical protein
MKIIINLGREILLLGSVRESVMKPSETSSGKHFLAPVSLDNNFFDTQNLNIFSSVNPFYSRFKLAHWCQKNPNLHTNSFKKLLIYEWKIL